MKQALLLLAVAGFMAPAVAGCLEAGGPLDQQGTLGTLTGFDTSRGWSMPRSAAVYDLLDAVKQFVPADDGVELALGVFRPAITGCDWDADTLPAHCRLPVVMDAGPYYGPNVDRDKYRPPIVEWLVPRGYAVVQMSLRGTGESGGCLEFKDPKDADDITAVIDTLANAAWTNGNVGMIGRSYDGTSAWAGAARGHPALKTIVPISGAVDAPHLYYKNGTSEVRGPIHGATYWPFYGLGLGDGGDPTRRADSWNVQLCEGAVADVHRESAYATATGDASSDYWQSRNLLPQIVENYQGSAWVIHGLEDWNVNPSQAVPTINTLIDAGIPTHAWLGVWGHAYPDRIDEHRNVRWDWADRVVTWFDHYLKDQGPAPKLGVEVEDNLFVWRHEDAYPPRDATWRGWHLSGDRTLTESDPQDGSAMTSGTASATFTSEPVAEPTRIAGLPRLHVTASPTTPEGAHVFATLYDVYPDGRTSRLGWAAMNLRYHAGGNTEPATLTPGEPVLAKMEFEPMDAIIAKGHRLRLVLHQDGVEDVLPSPSPEPTMLTLGADSTLLLPIVDRGTFVPAYVAPGLA